MTVETRVELVVANKERFFPHLYDMLAFKAITVQAISRARDIAGWIDQSAAEIPCPCADLVMHAVLDGYVTHVMEGSLPPYILLQVRDGVRYGTPRGRDQLLPTYHLIDHQVMGSIFSLFADEAVEWVKANVSTDYDNWPPVANFARVIRNGIVHRAISMNNQNAPIVSWKTRSIGPANHGERVFHHKTFDTGDLIPLMMDLENELTSLGAPFSLSP